MVSDTTEVHCSLANHADRELRNSAQQETSGEVSTESLCGLASLRDRSRTGSLALRLGYALDSHTAQAAMDNKPLHAVCKVHGDGQQQQTPPCRAQGTCNDQRE